jgi:hypothetical protein
LTDHPVWVVANLPPLVSSSSSSAASTRASEPAWPAGLSGAPEVLPLLGAIYGVPLRVVPPATKEDDDPTRTQVYRVSSTGVRTWSSDGRELGSASADR